MPSEPETGATGRSFESSKNPTAKLVRSLSLRKHRRETGLFVAEGVKVVATAREFGWIPELLIVQQGSEHETNIRNLVGWAGGLGARCTTASEAAFSSMASRDNPQNLLAVFKQRWVEPPRDIEADGLWIALDEVRDPGNLGTILRTCDAVGGGGILLIGDCCDPFSREAVRATMGSIFAVPIARMTAEGFGSFADAWPGEVIGTHLRAAEDFRRSYGGAILLVMGNEGRGLTGRIADKCTTLVKIPMVGGADSLNLAIATALMAYEVRRGKLGR